MGEKGMRDEGDQGPPQVSTAAPGAPEGGSAAGGARVSTVAPPDSGQRSIADEQGVHGPRREPGGAPSGSITHPRTDHFEQATLSKDADGTWRASNDERGEAWSWDPSAELWRGEGGTPDWEGPPPEDLARDLSMTE